MPRPALMTPVVVALLLTGCSADPVERAAQEACECLEPVRGKIQEMMAAMQGGDQQAMSNAGAGMQEISEQVDTCMNRVREKYRELDQDPAKRQAVGLRIAATCPIPGMGPGG